MIAYLDARHDCHEPRSGAEPPISMSILTSRIRPSGKSLPRFDESADNLENHASSRVLGLPPKIGWLYAFI